MYHILVCDDEARYRLCAENIPAGLHGPRAYTGKEALNILAREPIQLILLDIMMPEMDGITALGPHPGDIQRPSHPADSQERGL